MLCLLCFVCRRLENDFALGFIPGITVRLDFLGCRKESELIDCKMAIAEHYIKSCYIAYTGIVEHATEKSMNSVGRQ